MVYPSWVFSSEDNAVSEESQTRRQALLARTVFRRPPMPQAVKVVETVDNLIAEAEADSRTLDLSVLPYIQNSPIIQQLRVSLRPPKRSWLRWK